MSSKNLGFFYLSVLFFILSSCTSSLKLNEHFKTAGVNGSITIYDLNADEWVHSDKTKSNDGSLPASTFKVINTLIALEEGIVNGKDHKMIWDGKPKLFKTFPVASWNKDNTLEMAFKNSTIWYFERISEQLEENTYQKYLNACKYSNAQIDRSSTFDFWNFGGLKVTPVEQVELLIKLYKNQLPFSKSNQKIVRDIMIETETEHYTIRSKTGWCYFTKNIGWYIGYLETSDNTIFFATRIEKELDQEMKNFSKLRKTITKDVLQDLYSIDFSRNK